MYHPNAERLKTAEAEQFFTNFVRPQLPDDRAMPNHGENSPLRERLSEALLTMLASNIQRTILLSF